MDDPGLDPDRHRAALVGLSRLNALSVSDRALFRPIRRLARELGRPVRVLDVACGGGDQIVRLARRARRAGIELRPTGCDTSPVALDVAAQTARRAGVEARFVRSDVVLEGVPSGYDAVVCSLFAHHLDDRAVIRLFESIDAAEPRLAVVQDLRRTRAGALLAFAASQLLTRSAVVHEDALLSVGAAFTRPEVVRLAERAGLRDPRPRRVWPLRWQLTWHPVVDTCRMTSSSVQTSSSATQLGKSAGKAD